MSDLISRAKSLLLSALDIASEREREAFVRNACGDDVQLRNEVIALLDHENRLGRFLERAADGHNGIEPCVTENPGGLIDQYRLLEQIGEGGFGVVFSAEQERPVRRRVALKVIKPGMDTRQVIARFEAERQALAMMDHVNIAKVYDAGETKRRERRPA